MSLTPQVPDGPRAFLASLSSPSQLFFCSLDSTTVTGPLLGSPGLVLGPTLQLFILAHVEPAACPSALLPSLETDLYLYPFPPSSFSPSLSPQAGLSPISLLPAGVCVSLSPPIYLSLALFSSYLLPSFLPLPAIYLASHPMVFLSDCYFLFLSPLPPSLSAPSSPLGSRPREHRVSKAVD